jgi:hypothetical protein
MVVRVLVKVSVWLVLLTFTNLSLMFDVLHAQEKKGEASQAVPVSSAHALFGQQCEFCHEPLRGVVEQLCVRCHAGPAHNVVQTFTPPCGTCHTEHKGEQQLAMLSNDSCVSCHADVQLQEGATVRFAKKVTDFTQDHPQFALTVANGTSPRRLRLDDAGARQSDRATLKLNHELHLKPNLKSSKGPVQLDCKDCHAPDTDGMAMKPVKYEEHCQDCHALGFDPQFPNRVVPHGDVLYLHSYLVMTFSERRQEKPATPATPQRSGRLTRPVPSVAPISVSPSVAQRVAAAERYLYSVTCNKCHIVEGTGQPLPRIVPTAVPKIWFPHSRFAHRAHRMLECAACHEGVEKSSNTADVLLPGIQVCRDCHRASAQKDGAQQQSAPTECVTCHGYHDKSKDIQWNGPFTVKQVLTGEGAKRTNPSAVPGQARP